MAQNIYALLVGINNYPSHIPSLAGCVNDVANVKHYLRDTFGDGANIVELLNSDANRENVIREFRNHLGQAKAGDVVLFQYAGHGAQSKSAPEFSSFSPSGWDEGLVLHDSRSGGNDDLADKELAVLLAELGKNGPHISVWMDCCHSGSATRTAADFSQFKLRQTHSVNAPWPLDSYLDGHYSQMLQSGAPIYLPSSRHILMAACDRKQKAWEGKDRQGVFTQALMETLQNPGQDLSYAGLFLRCREFVRNYVQNQDPQFETYAGFHAYSGFLGQNANGANGGSGRCTVVFDSKSHQWQLNRGAIHGLSTAADRTATLDVYAVEHPESSIGTARTIQVGAQTSPLQFDGFSPQQGQQYEAELTNLPAALMPVALIADAAVSNDIFALLQNTTDQIREFEFVAADSATTYVLRVDAEAWRIEHRETSKLITGARGAVPECALHIFGSLNRIAHWERTLQLQNHHTQLNPADIDFHLVDVDDKDVEHRVNSTDFTFNVQHDGDLFRGKLKAHNTTAQELHFSLLYLAQDYSVAVPCNMAVDPTQQAFEFVFPTGDDDGNDDGNGQESPFIFAGLDDGESESQFFLKLLVSTERVDDFLLKEAGVADFGQVKEFDNATRGMSFGAAPKGKITHDNEWFTKTLSIRVIRQNGAVRSDQDITLADGKITIKANSALTAGVSLASAKTSHRSVAGDSRFYQALEQAGATLVNFSSTRGQDTSVLELSDISVDDTALREHPLKIELDLDLAQDEFLLPLAFDGEHILLTGEPSRSDNGRTQISIKQFPDIPDDRRSLGRALKLYFFKTYLKRKNVNRLCWVEYKADGTVERHVAGVAQRVATAQRVLLLIHGIIGDTADIAAGLPEAKDGQGGAVNAKFDLVLTYDYENLNTPIEQTARQLKQQLKDVGLHDTDDRHLTLLVHSMGGLVARWLIEREGGHRFVDHLVMCGTPNAGSPFGKIDGARNITSVLTTLGINAFPAFAPFGGALLYALNRSNAITGCLEQMNADSEFVKTLNASDDPGVRYTIVAADTREYAETSEELAAKLIAKLARGFLFDTLYAAAAHDIAVSVDSIRTVPDDRQPPPNKQTIIGHHLNYFANPESLKTLAAIDW